MGNIDALRDWGFAGDYVHACWLMLQQDVPDDFVIATGKKHSVRDFLELAFSHVGLNWSDYVRVDPKHLRPADVNTLCGDASKARNVLKWEPTVALPELARMMVDADLNRAKDELSGLSRPQNHWAPGNI